MQLAVFRPSQELMKFTVAVRIKTLTVHAPLPSRLENDAQVTVLRNNGYGDIMKGEIEVTRSTTASKLSDA